MHIWSKKSYLRLENLIWMNWGCEIKFGSKNPHLSSRQWLERIEGENSSLRARGLIWIQEDPTLIDRGCKVKFESKKVHLSSRGLDLNELRSKSIFETKRAWFEFIEVCEVIECIKLHRINWFELLNSISQSLGIHWHHLRVKVQELLTSTMKRTSIFGNSNWRGDCLPWTFRALWMNPRKLCLLRIIPKWRKIMKGVPRRKCPSLHFIWQIANLHI